MPGLRKYFSVGAADVVGFEFVGTNGLAALDMLPAQAGDDSAVGIINLLAFNPCGAEGFGQGRIGCDDEPSLNFGRELLARQQTFAVLQQYGLGVALATLIGSALVINALVVADVDFVAAGVEGGQYATASGARPCDGFQ